MIGFRRAAISVAMTAVLFVVATACGNGPSTSSSSGGGGKIGMGGVNLGPPGVVVQATDQPSFAPNASTVKVGQIVEWQNNQTQLHNVTFDDHDEVTTSDLGAQKKWDAKFTVPGKYDYHCTIHPTMTATLTVTA